MKGPGQTEAGVQVPVTGWAHMICHMLTEATLKILREKISRKSPIFVHASRKEVLFPQPRDHKKLKCMYTSSYNPQGGNDLSVFACVRLIFPYVLDDILMLSSYSLSIHPVLLQSPTHCPPTPPPHSTAACSLPLLLRPLISCEPQEEGTQNHMELTFSNPKEKQHTHWYVR